MTKQYRLLEFKEIIREGDEVLINENWLKVFATVGSPVSLRDVGMYRRKIKM